MKPLYCFKFDDITGEVTQIQIPKYAVGYAYVRKKVYHFECSEIVKNQKQFTVEEKKFDRFVNGKIYTFNGDRKAAIDLMLKTMKDKKKYHDREMRRWNKLYVLLWRAETNEIQADTK